MYVYILAQHYFNISTCFVSFSNTYTNIEAIYHLYLDVEMMGVMGEGLAYGILPFPDTGCRVTPLYQVAIPKKNTLHGCLRLCDCLC